MYLSIQHVDLITFKRIQAANTHHHNSACLSLRPLLTLSKSTLTSTASTSLSKPTRKKYYDGRYADASDSALEMTKANALEAIYESQHKLDIMEDAFENFDMSQLQELAEELGDKVAPIGLESVGHSLNAIYEACERLEEIEGDGGDDEEEDECRDKIETKIGDLKKQYDICEQLLMRYLDKGHF